MHSWRPAFSRLVYYFLFCLAGTARSELIHLHETAPVMRVSRNELKHPLSWLYWGFDYRLRYEWVNNAVTLQDGRPDSELSYFRFRPRLWASISAAENVHFSLRLVSEPRYFFRPEVMEGWVLEEGLFDLFNLQISNFLAQPLVLTAGRQEFNFGNRWLIFDATPTDGTRTEFFDAVRLTFSPPEAKTTADVIYVFQYSDLDYWLPAINDLERGISEQDDQAGIVYIRNQSLEKSTLEGYVIYRDQTRVLVRGNEGHTWVTGGRAEYAFTSRWQARLEPAYEWGELNGREHKGWGLNTLLTYQFGGQWKHRIRAGYEYLSGDDPDTPENEGWDPMWGRRALWGELGVLRFSAENRGRSADYKNLQRVTLGWSASPAKWLEVNADYMPLFANEPAGDPLPAYAGNGHFRGHFLQSVVRLNVSRNWSGLVWMEFFWPGDYYAVDHRDMANFLRLEVLYRF